MDIYADFVDAVPVHPLHRETDVVRGEHVTFAREVALELEHQSRQGLGLAPHIGKGVFAQAEDACEIPEVGLALEYVTLGLRHV